MLIPSAKSEMPRKWMVRVNMVWGCVLYRVFGFFLGFSHFLESRNYSFIDLDVSSRASLLEGSALAESNIIPQISPFVQSPPLLTYFFHLILPSPLIHLLLLTIVDILSSLALALTVDLIATWAPLHRPKHLQHWMSGTTLMGFILFNPYIALSAFSLNHKSLTYLLLFTTLFFSCLPTGIKTTPKTQQKNDTKKDAKKDTQKTTKNLTQYPPLSINGEKSDKTQNNGETFCAQHQNPPKSEKKITPKSVHQKDYVQAQNSEQKNQNSKKRNESLEEENWDKNTENWEKHHENWGKKNQNCEKKNENCEKKAEKWEKKNENWEKINENNDIYLIEKKGKFSESMLIELCFLGLALSYGVLLYLHPFLSFPLGIGFARLFHHSLSVETLPPRARVCPTSQATGQPSHLPSKQVYVGYNNLERKQESFLSPPYFANPSKEYYITLSSLYLYALLTTALLLYFSFLLTNNNWGLVWGVYWNEWRSLDMRPGLSYFWGALCVLFRGYETLFLYIFRMHPYIHAIPLLRFYYYQPFTWCMVSFSLIAISQTYCSLLDINFLILFVLTHRHIYSAYRLIVFSILSLVLFHVAISINVIWLTRMALNNFAFSTFVLIGHAFLIVQLVIFIHASKSYPLFFAYKNTCTNPQSKCSNPQSKCSNPQSSAVTPKAVQ